MPKKIIAAWHKTGSSTAGKLAKFLDLKKVDYFDPSRSKKRASADLVIWIRHPWEIITSAMLYHSAGIESHWLNKKPRDGSFRNGEHFPYPDIVNNLSYIEELQSRKSMEDKLIFEMSQCSYVVLMKIYRTLKKHPKSFVWKLEEAHETDAELKIKKMLRFLKKPLNLKSQALKIVQTVNNPTSNYIGSPKWPKFFTQKVIKKFFEIYPQDFFDIFPYDV